MRTLKIQDDRLSLQKDDWRSNTVIINFLAMKTEVNGSYQVLLVGEWPTSTIIIHSLPVQVFATLWYSWLGTFSRWPSTFSILRPLHPSLMIWILLAMVLPVLSSLITRLLFFSDFRFLCFLSISATFCGFPTIQSLLILLHHCIENDLTFQIPGRSRRYSVLRLGH